MQWISFSELSDLRLGLLPQLHGQGTWQGILWMLDSWGLPCAGRLWTTWPLWSGVLEYVQKLRCGFRQNYNLQKKRFLIQSFIQKRTSRDLRPCLAYIPNKTLQSFTVCCFQERPRAIALHHFTPCSHTREHQVVAVFHWSKSFWCCLPFPYLNTWDEASVSFPKLCWEVLGDLPQRHLVRDLGCEASQDRILMRWTDLPRHCNLDDETQHIKHPGRSRFTNGKEPCEETKIRLPHS